MCDKTSRVPKGALAGDGAPHVTVSSRPAGDRQKEFCTGPKGPRDCNSDSAGDHLGVAPELALEKVKHVSSITTTVTVEAG